MATPSGTPVEEGARRVRVFERSVAAWLTGGPIPEASAERAVLVEGASDRAAVVAVAESLDRDLASAGVAVLPMGGAMSVRRFVTVLGPQGLGLPLHGLCDRAELRYFTRAGLGPNAINVCDPDLEAELIRALGVPGVEAVLEAEADLRLFRTFQQQPAQRGRNAEAQLHRFLGTTSGRKEHYARALAQALPPDRIPPPLGELVDAVSR